MSTDNYSDRLDTIRALYALHKAFATLQAFSPAPLDQKKMVSDQLAAADESITKLLNRLERDLGNADSS